MFQVPAADSMTGFMVSNDLLFFRRDDLVLLFQSADDPVDRILEIFHFHIVFSLTGSNERGFITNICDVGAGKAWRLFGQLMNIQLAGDLYRLEMYFENSFAAFQIRLVDGDLTVETARTQQGCIQYVRTVRRSQYDDTAVAAKTIHFHKQLIEGAFPFIIAHNGILTAGTTNGVDLIDEDDARCLFTGLLEQVTDTAGAYTHEQLDEVRTAH